MLGDVAFGPPLDSSRSVEQPTPSNCGDKWKRPPVIRVVAIVNEHWVTEEILSGEETPVPTIVGCIPVVTHPEYMTFRNNQWSPVPEIGQVVFLVDRIDEMRQLPTAGSEPLRTIHPDRRIHMPDIRFGHVLAVAEQRVMSHLNSVTRNSNQALHYGENWLLDPLKNDKFALLRFANRRRPHTRERHSGAVKGLVYEERVTDM